MLVGRVRQRATGLSGSLRQQTLYVDSTPGGKRAGLHPRRTWKPETLGPVCRNKENPCSLAEAVGLQHMGSLPRHLDKEARGSETHREIRGHSVPPYSALSSLRVIPQKLWKPAVRASYSVETSLEPLWAF